MEQRMEVLFLIIYFICLLDFNNSACFLYNINYIAICNMKTILIIFIIVSSCLLGFAQGRFQYGPGGTTVHENAKLDAQKEEDGFVDRLAELIPYKEKYLYSEFRDGRIFYVPHRESSLIKLNYNRYRSLISMIDEKGDTSFVANFKIIKYILVKSDLYYHDHLKGYFEILSHPDDSIRLLVQRQLNIRSREVLKDYEKPKPVSTEKLFTILYVPRNPTFARENVTISRDVVYYLMNEKDEIFIANKSAFLKLFQKHKQKIEYHLAQLKNQRTPIKFDKEGDLRKLLLFCLDLSTVN